MDSLSPKEIAQKVLQAGKEKVNLKISQTILLGILAGLFIGFGAQFYMAVIHDTSFSIGFSKFIGGGVFSLGLVLVVLAGAELFTGNSLMVISVLSKEVFFSKLMKNWGIVYLANFAGALLLVLLVYYSGLNDSGIGVFALKTAIFKVNLTFLEAFLRAILCNILVCLAVWIAISGRDSASKILGIFLPITGFVAMGFEHSVANMYFIPMGLLLKNNSAISSLVDKADTLTLKTLFLNNLIPVTLGNIVGGVLFVAVIYYYVYKPRLK